MNTGLPWVTVACGMALAAFTEAKEVSVVLGDPVVISQAPPHVRQWGPWQFPGLQRLADGRIQINYHVEADSATAYGKPLGRAISADEGKTWTPVDAKGNLDTRELGSNSTEVSLANGDRIMAKVLRSRKASELALPVKPFASYLSYGQPVQIYRPEDLPKECLDGWRLYRLPKGKAQWVEEQARVDLPGQVRRVVEGVMPFPWFCQLYVASDGSQWAAHYDRRIVNGQLQKCSAIFLRSTDQGKTWNFWSEIPYVPDLNKDLQGKKREGFTEPATGFMPDGPVLCLLRTTDSEGPGPLYRAHSRDHGKTWTQPEVFDDIGVWPQLLVLKNGVTLAAYGRPGLYVRATEDPAGIRWGPRIQVVQAGKLGTETCSYTALLALSDDTALLAYSNFNVPDKEGRPCKTILVRTVKVAK